MRRTAMSAGRRANYARLARSRFARDERELQPAVERAIQLYLDHLGARFRRHAPSLVAAATDETGEDPADVFGADDAAQLASVLDEAGAEWNPIMDAEIMPTYQRVMDKVLQHGLADPRISTDLVKWRNQWLADRRQQLVGIPEFVSDSMRSELADLARADGTSVDTARGVIDKMLNVGWDTWQNRSQLIARTETVGANNQGSLASWSLMSQATGTEAVKTWLATGDERTRQDHADVDGLSVALADNFDVGGTPMNGPGDPAGGPEQVCNCRCTLTYEFPDGSQTDTPPADVAGQGDGEGDPEADPEALTAAAGPQSGVALMLGLGITDEQECAAPGVEVDPPGLHCTVAYLADPATSYTDEQKAGLLAALEELGAQLPLQADAFATAHFNKDDPERDDCAVLLVQSDSLQSFHDAVADVLATQGLDVSTAFPIWIPHVAIAYNADPSVIPEAAVGRELEFNRLVLGWGGEQIVAAGDGAPDPAGQTDAQPMTAAVEAPVTAPADAPPADAPPADAPAEDAAPTAPVGPGWEGPVALLDVASSDGRIISSGGGIIRPLPLPLSWQRESGDDHDDSVVVGRVLAVEPRGNVLWATGDWLDPMICYDSQQAMAQVDAGLGLVSVDLALTEIGFADAEGNLIDPTVYEAPDDTAMVALGWEFGGVTLVSFPAFPEARITNIPDAEDDTGTDLVEGPPIIMGDPGTFSGANPAAPVISDDGTSIAMPDGSTVAVGDPVSVPGPDGTPVNGTVSSIDVEAQTVSVTPPPAEDGTQPDDLVVDVADLAPVAAPPATDDASLQAAAAVQPYTRSLFEQRELDGPTPVTYDPETGAVYGHLGTWGQCHLGKLAETGKCVTVPPAPGGDYSYFHTTPMPMDDGDMLGVGRLTVGTGHAGPRGGFRGALEHYDNSGTQVALVRAYEDDYGVQVAGQVIHGTPPERIEELLRAPISGDWRLVDPSPGQPIRLVAALGVNVPGFPVVPRIGMVGKRQVSLVAAGVVQLVDEQPAVRLPSGVTIAAADMEALVAAASRALAAHPQHVAVARDDEAARTALRLARARMRLRTMARV